MTENSCAENCKHFGFNGLKRWCKLRQAELTAQPKNCQGWVDRYKKRLTSDYAYLDSANQ